MEGKMKKEEKNIFKAFFRKSVIELKNNSIVEDDGLTLRNDLLARAFLDTKGELKK
jgi:hypothetical protein